MARGYTYTNKAVLKNLKDVFGRIAATNANSANGVNFRNYFHEIANGTRYTQEQRNAAKAIEDELRRFSDLQMGANSRKGEIADHLDKDNYFNRSDEDINGFIGRLDDNINTILENFETFAFRDNYDEVPNPGSRIWKFLPVISDLKEALLELKEVQAQNGIANYLDNEKELETSLIHQATLMSDGTDPKEVADELGKAERDYLNAKTELREFASENKRSEYRKKYEHAYIRLQQIPEQINAIDKKQARLKSEISTTKSRLEELPHMKDNYIHMNNALMSARKDLLDTTSAINDEIEKYNKAIKEIEAAPGDLRKAVNTNKSGNDKIKQQQRDYAKKKETEMRWQKVAELSDELKKLLENGNPLVRTALFAKLGPVAGSNGVMYTPKMMKQFTAGFNDAQKEALNRGRELKEQILALVPEESRKAFDELIHTKASEDPKVALARFPAEAYTKLHQANDAVSNDPFFKEHRRAQKEFDACMAALNKNAELLYKLKQNKKPSKGDLDDIKQLEDTEAQLQEKMFKLTEDVTVYDTRFLDEHVANVVSMESRKALADAKRQELEEKQEAQERSVTNLSETCSKMRQELIDWMPDKDQFLNFDNEELRKGKGEQDKNNDLFGVAGKRMLEEMVAEDWQDPASMFDQVEARLKNKLESDQTDLNKVTENNIDELRNEERQCERDIKNYSYDAYREELHDKHVDMENAETRVKKLRAMNDHLGLLQEQYNNRAELSAEAVQKVDKLKDDVIKRVEEIKANFNKAKKWNSNSTQYTAIETQLNRFTKDTLKDMSPEQIKTALGDLSNAAQRYIDKKNTQIRLFPTSQRVYRIAYANSIIDFVQKQQQAIDKMGITEKAYQQIAADKLNPPQKITDKAEFAAKVSDLAAPYMENPSVRNFKSYLQVLNGYSNQKMTEGDYTTDEERREWAKKAIAAGAVKNKIWDVKRGQTSLHLTAMRTLYDSEMEHAESRYGKQIDKTVAAAKRNPNLVASNASYKRKMFDASQNYNSIPDYTKGIEDRVKNNADQMRKEGKPLNIII